MLFTQLIHRLIILLPLLFLAISTFNQPSVLAAPTDVFATDGDNERVEEITRAYFSDVPVMAEIAWCESKFKQFDERDGGVERGDVTSEDVGVMQVNEYFHKDVADSLGLDLHTLGGNLLYARYLYEKEGTRPWNSSKHCWKNRI